MEIRGKIIRTTEIRRGTSSSGNSWAAKDYLIEEVGKEYPKSCAFTVFGEDRINNLAIREGMVGTVSLDIHAREYNGKFYNDIRAWRFMPEAPDAQSQPQPQPQPQPQSQSQDLPF